VRNGLSRTNNGIPIPLGKLSKYTNYIERGTNIVIGGRPTTGKTSFMDYLYFISVFKWWRELDMPAEDRPPLKFYYFNLKERKTIKVQKWFCLYMKLYRDKVIDIPTLNSDIGKLYDLSDSDKEAIQEADEFFDELEDHIVFVNNPQTPSDIYNRVKRDMEECGGYDEEGNFRYSEENLGMITFVLTNNTERLVPETDGFQMMNTDALKRKFSTYMDDLKNIFNTVNVWIEPSKVSNSRMVRDSEPTYKELGHASKIADIGIVLYNPFNENNNNYQNYPVEKMIIRGKNRLRTATIVRNSRGLENITVGLIFLGECGYFRESPHPNDEDDWDTIDELLRELP
jgi:hypothetical protein